MLITEHTPVCRECLGAHGYHEAGCPESPEPPPDPRDDPLERWLADWHDLRCLLDQLHEDATFAPTHVHAAYIEAVRRAMPRERRPAGERHDA